MIIKVIKNNNPRREDSFFIENVKDLNILKISLTDVREYVRTICPEFEEYCKNKEHLDMITYADIVRFYNWNLSTLALQTVDEADKYDLGNPLKATQYYDLILGRPDNSIFMDGNSRINLLFFKIPDEVKPNKFIDCLLSTTTEDVYIINDKGQTIDSIKQR